MRGCILPVRARAFVAWADAILADEIRRVGITTRLASSAAISIIQCMACGRMHENTPPQRPDDGLVLLLERHQHVLSDRLLLDSKRRGPDRRVVLRVIGLCQAALA